MLPVQRNPPFPVPAKSFVFTVSFGLRVGVRAKVGRRADALGSYQCTNSVPLYTHTHYPTERCAATAGSPAEETSEVGTGAWRQRRKDQLLQRANVVVRREQR